MGLRAVGFELSRAEHLLHRQRQQRRIEIEAFGRGGEMKPMNPNLFVVVRPEANSPAPAQRSVYAGAREPNAYQIKFLSVILGLLTLTAHAADGFKPLYNGKDLSGWHVKDSKYQNWVANGEILLCKKGEVGIANGNGWLTTDKEYGDFILRVEWKLPAGGNSGVAIRFPKDGEPAHEGMEIQMLDDASPDNAKRPPEERSGSLYVEVAPLRKTDKPVGEWNKTEITCKGSMLSVKNNGVETLKLNLDDLKILHGPHRQYKPVSQRPRKGFIGLQGDRGMQVEFRNILIKEL